MLIHVLNLDRTPDRLRELPNLEIDVMMSNAYSQIQSFAAFPPLVITKNERSKSTIQLTEAGA